MSKETIINLLRDENRWLEFEVIAKKLGISYRSVKRGVGKLINEGEVEILDYSLMHHGRILRKKLVRVICN